jgi:DNA modification methylase
MSGGDLKPYYDDGGGRVIYHGDCREIMARLHLTFIECALITDPPYKVKFDAGTKRSRKTGLAFGRHAADAVRDPDFEDIVGQDEPFDPAPWLTMGWREIILWGGNRYASRLPDSTGWLVWNKLEDKQPCDFGDGEAAWTNLNQPMRLWNQLWRGLVRRGEENVANGPKLHQFQKPIELMRWCVGFTTAPLIVDPYMGSGPTLQAAKEAGRSAIGIDIVERNCANAANRLRQDVLFGGAA